MGYKKEAAKGISWITGLRAATRLVTIARFSILGRILTPTQFGIFGIASLLLAFLEIITETGVNIFLVQQKDSIDEYINTAWVISIVRGLLLCLLIFLFAPIIASFFNAKAAVSIIYLMAIVPLIRGFINPAEITFQKELHFHKEFLFRTVLLVSDATIAIISAFITKSAASFVYGVVGSALLEVILSFYFIQVWPSLELDFKKLLLIFRKGWWVTLTGIFQYFAENGDNIAVGKILGTAPLGIYNVAYKFSTLPITEITNVVNTVVFPVYMKFAEDKKRLIRAFFQVTALSSVGALFIGITLFLFAKEIILILMGQQWVAAVPVIKVLALYGVLRTVFGNFAPVFLSIHRQDIVARMTFFRVTGLLITIIPFVMKFGLVGAGYSALLSIVVEIPVICYFSIKVFSGHTSTL